MADLLKSLLGGSKAKPQDDDDFADFAGAPDPKPASVIPPQADPVGAHGAEQTLGAPPKILYTKWYRVWERTTPRDFISEAIILPFIIIVVVLHAWGRKTNKARAKAWITAHGPSLQKEYAQIGFSGPKPPSVEDVQQSGLANAMTAIEKEVPEGLLKEKSAQEYTSYATGRQNVAFTDVRMQLYKRYNPATLLVEAGLSLIFDSIPAPCEKIDLTTYAFDGREKELVPAKTDEQKDSITEQGKTKSSVYDPFVWAVVNKETMKKLRDERYDVSLTFTRDHAKLPAWAAVMSESAEITETLLTPELLKALETAGDTFQHLIVTDQPLDKPTNLDETKPRKRLSLSLNLPSNSSSPSSYEPTLPIFNYFLRLPDILAEKAHFRPEVTRKVRQVREEEQKKLSKASEEEKAEERRLESEKKKREIRDKKMRGMSAEEQKKFLDRERERSTKKQEKKRTQKA